MGATGDLDLFNDRVNASWPLIRNLMNDPVYRAEYRAQVENLLGTVFEPSRLAARFQAESARITPYVIGPEGEQQGSTSIASPAEFTQAVANLVTYVQARHLAVRQALGSAR